MNSEACSSTLATTYSSGSYDERQIATTDIRHSCTSNHTGTSASAPIAAGICALVLESNPMLTWRDMQHIVVRTAKPANLVAKDWRPNALGRNVSHAFGYGLMDAAAMIQLAKRWKTVPYQYKCEIKAPKMDKIIPAKGYIELKLRVGCANVSYLEHVQSNLTLTAARRGDLHIYLTSPHGTRSTLLAQRPNDQSEQGFRYWPFMTVHSWGESPDGVWTLEVHNDGKPSSLASLKWWSLMMHGTREDPNKHLDLDNNIIGTTSPPPPTSLSEQQHHRQQQQQPMQPVARPSPPSGPPAPSRLPANPPAPTFSPGGGAAHSDDADTGRLTASTPPGQQHQPKRPQLTTPASTAPAGQVSTQSSSSLPPPASDPAEPDKPQGKPVPSVTQSSANESTSGTTTAPSSEHKSGQHRPEEAPGVSYDQRPGETKDPSRLAGPVKADFEIVSAPSNSARPQSAYNHSSSSSSSTDALSPSLSADTVTPTSPRDPPGPATSPSGDPTAYLNNKPPVQLIDSNKIDATLAPTVKPPLPPPPASVGGDIHQQQQQQQQNELDANQLESKLTKDYRSSGGGNGPGEAHTRWLQVDQEASIVLLPKEKQRDNSASSWREASRPLIGFNLVLVVYLHVALVWRLQVGAGAMGHLLTT